MVHTAMIGIVTDMSVMSTESIVTCSSQKKLKLNTNQIHISSKSPSPIKPDDGSSVLLCYGPLSIQLTTTNTKLRRNVGKCLYIGNVAFIIMVNI